MGVVCQFLAKFSSCVLLEVSIIVKEFLQYFTEIWGGSDRNNEMKFGQKKTKLWDRASVALSVIETHTPTSSVRLADHNDGSTPWRGAV